MRPSRAALPTSRRHDRQRLSYRFLSVVAIGALALACATIIQRAYWTQSAHYALVRALADGTPRIDRYHDTTGDLSFTNGHYYAAKAPGLALLSQPAYLAVVRPLMGSASDATRIWLLNLLVTIPFAVLLLALVRRVADVFEPGSGTLVALTLGAATIVFPFTTLYFSHVAAAALGFAAFFVLFRARSAPVRLGSIAIAGFLAGIACVFEFPSAIVAVGLAAYALARDRPLGRLVAYGLGGIVGLAPLLAYNAWAFGNPFTLSYNNVVGVQGTSGHDVVGAQNFGVFGLTTPSLRAASELLLENRGLLTLTPVAAAGIAGAVLLYRRGLKAEGLLFIGLAAAFLAYNSGLHGVDWPFGGSTPGPRYLIGALPYVFAPIGLAYRRAPGTTIALALVSVGTMALATITGPMIFADSILVWPKDALAGAFQTTIVSILGGPSGYAAVAPFALLLGIAIAAAAATIPRGWLARRDLADAATAVVLWLIVAYAIRSLVVPEPTLASAALSIVLAGAAIAVQVVVIRRVHRDPVRRTPASAAPHAPS